MALWLGDGELVRQPNRPLVGATSPATVGSRKGSEAVVESPPRGVIACRFKIPPAGFVSSRNSRHGSRAPPLSA
ncbi:hypothetical protein MRB53_005354 [Persea americana]|uniref:Uncharacterized protein n=1 Tax=Persea americana TaxID=3435 RepID=A0ACC2MD85_PERAE|nr:hypothetical protein MRB53_005354 [Persea americana]